MAGKTCVICGEPSGMYPLCRTHLQEKNNGNVVKCEECGTWHYVDKPCKCKKETPQEAPIESACQEDGKCIVCGEDAPHGSLCRDCYYEMIDYKDTFDKNSKVYEFKDYYFNLKSNIYRMKDFERIQSQCNKLMALATLTKALFNDESLTDRIVNDIKEIIEKKKPKEEQKITEYAKQQDSLLEGGIRTLDNHHVKSQGERQIDDILYQSFIVHSYGDQVCGLPADEQTVESDWFIPIKSIVEGIYIEYWGMNTKEYLANKERKRKAYKEHNIPLIEIEKDEINDIKGLTIRIIRELNKLAKQHYNIDKFK